MIEFEKSIVLVFKVMFTGHFYQFFHLTQQLLVYHLAICTKFALDNNNSLVGIKSYSEHKSF